MGRRDIRETLIQLVNHLILEEAVPREGSLLETQGHAEVVNNNIYLHAHGLQVALWNHKCCSGASFMPVKVHQPSAISKHLQFGSLSYLGVARLGFVQVLTLLFNLHTVSAQT